MNVYKMIYYNLVLNFKTSDFIDQYRKAQDETDLPIILP